LKQPLWRTVWRFLLKLRIKLPYDPAIPLLGIYPDETIIGKDTCPLSPEPPPYPSIPSHPSRLSQSTRLSSLCYTGHSHWLSILYMAAYTCQCYSLNSSHSLLPWLCFKFVLYVYVSILVLQIGSSVPFF